MPAVENILEAQGLTKEFKGFVAVDGVDLKVRRGSVHALIGPNGAGKTTCFNLCTKFLDPTRGTIIFNGMDITGYRPARVARMGVVRSFQISAVFLHASVLENVRLAIQSKKVRSLRFWSSRRLLDSLHEEAEALLEEVGLREFVDVRAGDLPYGRKRALELATTLALQPELLLLDEPLAGIGSGDIEHVTHLIRKVAKSRTVLMVEHNLSVVSRLCDTVTVLARGKVLVQGSYEDVAAHPEVRAAYLGSDDHG
jgi:branched-chain amino acid transport system ATP-binding protein